MDHGYKDLHVASEEERFLGGIAIGSNKKVCILLAQRSDGTHIYQTLNLEQLGREADLTDEQAQVVFCKLQIALECLELNRNREWDAKGNILEPVGA